MVRKKISCYGPFRLSGKYIFSDFSNWSEKHNAGFNELIELAKKKKYVFDIGAHIGLTCLPLANVMDGSGKIYAFEPGSCNLYFLKKHLEANSVENVLVIEKLVGDRNGVNANFYEGDDVSGMNSMAKEPTLNRKKQVEMTTIDDFSVESGVVPEIIKIDVEGAELLVLNGAVEVLTKHSPVIFLSVHPRQIRKLGYSVGDLRKNYRKSRV